MPKSTKLDSETGIPIIMGILNATPDSFSDGGKYLEAHRALDRISIIIQNGAQIIDVGGESSRPGSNPVSVKEELNRVMPILESATSIFKKAEFSIDTTKYEVAKKALQAGASYVNDVSGMQKDPRLADLCAEFGSNYIIMHSQGEPKTMQKNPHYEDVVDEVKAFFESKIKDAERRGVNKIILDPGIGFGKNLEHNLRLVAHLNTFKEFGFPVMIGASRKSSIGQILGNRPVEGRLIGSIALHYHALTKGADILRVHDVKEASDSIRIFNAVQSQQ